MGTCTAFIIKHLGLDPILYTYEAVLSYSFCYLCIIFLTCFFCTKLGLPKAPCKKKNYFLKNPIIWIELFFKNLNNMNTNIETAAGYWQKLQRQILKDKWLFFKNSTWRCFLKTDGRSKTAFPGKGILDLQHHCWEGLLLWPLTMEAYEEGPLLMLSVNGQVHAQYCLVQCFSGAGVLPSFSSNVSQGCPIAFPSAEMFYWSAVWFGLSSCPGS